MKNLRFNELISDIESYEIHYFLYRKGEVTTNKENNIALKSIKGNGSNKEKYKYMDNDDSTNSDEEEMTLFVKTFIKSLDMISTLYYQRTKFTLIH